jgi:hypothetical protein
MVGLGGANAGELVVGGRGVAFICLEHFTGRVNPETYGMGLAPDLIPLWIAHELAHAVRYTSPTSQGRDAPPGVRPRRLLRLLGHRQPGHPARVAGERGPRGPPPKRWPPASTRRTTSATPAGSTTGCARWAFLRRIVDRAGAQRPRAAAPLSLRRHEPSARLVGGRCSRALWLLPRHRMAEALVAERGIAAALRAPRRTSRRRRIRREEFKPHKSVKSEA